MPVAVRLGLAWCLCLLPRATAALMLPLVGEYRLLQDPDADIGSLLYPAYEALGALLWWTSGQDVARYVALHVALHSLLGPLVYAICRQLRLGAAAAWLAVLGAAGLPYYVATSARQPQVPIVIAAVAALVWLFLGWRDRDFKGARGCAFACAGFASAFLRPNLLVTVAGLQALALWTALAMERRDGRRAARVSALASIALLALLLACAAGVARVRTGHWSPFPPVAGYNLYVGHNRHAESYLARHDIKSLEDVIRDHGEPAGVLGAGDARARDARYARLGLEYAREHPAQTAENTLRKAWRYWDWRLEDAERNPPLWNLVYTGPYVLYAGLALLGALALWRQGRCGELGVIALVIGSYWLPHLVLFPTVRMRMSTEFLLVILAAAGAVRLARGRASQPN